MKQTRSFVSFIISYTLIFSFLSFAVPSVSAQDSKISLQRGFRTGYSDGYMSGYRDTIDNATKSYQRHKEYKEANRAYNKDYGTIEDYHDGYRQGFEAGYDTGFEKRSFDATIPSTLSRRGPVKLEPNVAETKTTEIKSPELKTPIATTTKPVEENVTSSNPQTVTDNNGNYSDSTNTNNNQTVSYNPQTDDAIIIIPADTELIVELLDEIDTEKSSEGDAFKAKVVSPFEISGAIIEGRISKIQKPGRIKRRAEVLLTFDRIIVSEDRWSNYAAILTEVLPIKGDNVKRVDTEGTVEGKSSVKDDTIKVGATTGTGLIIGAIAGGPVGAAVGAGVGAAFGVGAVVIERGKHIHLNKEQQLRIKTAYNTQIR